MAIQPKDNESFYREVDEELRRAQLTGWWQRYAIPIIAGVVLLLGAIGGAIWWQHRQQVQAGERAETLIAAFDAVRANKMSEATPKLDQLAREGGPGYRAAALLTKADIASERGQTAAAIASYKAVADDADLPEAYRNLALVRQTALEFDTLAPDAVISRLAPLAVAGNPWFGSAGEMVAAAHLKRNNPKLAAPIFAAMAREENLPPSIRSRAVQMAGALGTDAIQEAPGVAAGAAAAKE